MGFRLKNAAKIFNYFLIIISGIYKLKFVKYKFKYVINAHTSK